jgi:hypothetical protein
VCQLADAGFRANKNKLNSKNAKRAMVQSRMVKKLKGRKNGGRCERVEAPELSRLQRKMLEKKLAKGTLRAAA